MTRQEIDKIVEMLSRHSGTITCSLPEECKKAAKQLCDDIAGEQDESS